MTQTFAGSRQQQVLDAYLRALSVEARDRVIGAACLEVAGNADGTIHGKGPCLVEVAEPGVVWGALAACRIYRERGRHPAYVFDEVMLRWPNETVPWIKARCAELNGSTAADVEKLTEATCTQEAAR